MPEPNAQLLIIEDDITLAQTIQELLRLLGYASEMIHDGKIALDYLQDAVPQLIFLDMHLPKVSGMEILQFIMADARFDSTQVIVMTADSALQKEAKNHTTALLKPISGEEIIAAVENALSRTDETNLT